MKMNSKVILLLGVIAFLPAPIDETSFLYTLQDGAPAAIQNFVEPELGCNWFGVGGQVFDSEGVPMTGIIVEVSGTLDGQETLRFAVTGTTLELGPGGFNIELADHPIASQGTLFFQLLDNTATPLSALVSLDTYNSCDKNLLLINLVEATFDKKIFMPIISK